MKANRRVSALYVFLACTLVAGLGLNVAHAATEPVAWDLVVDTNPARPTTEETVRVLLTVDALPDCTVLDFSEPPQIEGFRIRFQGRQGSPSVLCVPIRAEYEFTLPRLETPGDYRLEIMDGDVLLRSQRLEVVAPLRILSFSDSIAVTLRLTDPRVAPARDAPAVQLTKEAGYFWFFTPENIEVTVKVLDGRPVNGHYWIFLSGMTDLGLTVTVTNFENCASVNCPTKTYTNQPGKRLNIIDTNLF